MKEHELQKIIDTIDKVTDRAVEKYVNGKIRNLDEKVSKHIDKFDEHLEKDDEFKKALAPVLEVWTTTTSLGKFIKYMASIIIAFGVIVGVYSLEK